MPRITQFDAPELGLRPTETGITATAAAARRVGAEYSEAAAAQAASNRNIVETIQSAGEVATRFAEHQEISTGSVRGAQMLDNLTASKDARIKSLDPRDPAYGQKVEAVVMQWREQTLGPALEDFSKAFVTTKGQQFAQHFTASTQKSMFAHTTADISTAAGIGIANNIKTFANISSNNALRLPEMVPELLKEAERSVYGLVATSPLKGTHGAKFQAEILEKTKDQIVKAGAIGAIQKAADPEAEAQRWIGLYPQHLSGQEAITLANNARQQIRAREVDADRAELKQERLRKQESEAAANQYIKEAELRDPALANDPIAVRALNDQTLTKGDLKNVLGLLKRQLKPETDARISAETTIGFMSELRPGVRDVEDKQFEADFEQRVWDAHLKDPGTPGSLTKSDFNRLRAELAERKTPLGQQISTAKNDLLKAVKASITKANPLLGKSDPDGDLNLYRFEKDLERRIAEYRRPDSGKNWLDLFDPNKPDYFGNPKALEAYRKPLSESVRDISRRLGVGARSPSPSPLVPPAAAAPAEPALQAPPPAPQRKPGESVEAYRRRIRGE